LAPLLEFCLDFWHKKTRVPGAIKRHCLRVILCVCTSTVGVPARTFYGDGATPRHEQCTLYVAAEQKKATILVGLDLSAEFNTINHNVFISRLESQFGVDSGASRWLRSYLTDRQQFGKLGDHSSAMMLCASGVLQGSVLGPLLFTAYVSPDGELIESHGISSPVC